MNANSKLPKYKIVKRDEFLSGENFDNTVIIVEYRAGEPWAIGCKFDNTCVIIIVNESGGVALLGST